MKEDHATRIKRDDIMGLAALGGWGSSHLATVLGIDRPAALRAMRRSVYYRLWERVRLNRPCAECGTAIMTLRNPVYCGKICGQAAARRQQIESHRKQRKAERLEKL